MKNVASAKVISNKIKGTVKPLKTDTPQDKQKCPFCSGVNLYYGNLKPRMPPRPLDPFNVTEFSRSSSSANNKTPVLVKRGGVAGFECKKTNLFTKHVTCCLPTWT